MTREEIVALRDRLLLGSPAYKTGQMGEMLRVTGSAGLHERRHGGAYDAGANGILLALESCLTLCQHILDQMPRGKDE